VYSLDLNNSQRIQLTPGKSQTGGSRCKMAGAGIQSFAKFRAQMCTAECQGLKTVARFVAFRGNWSAECQQRLNSSTRHFTLTVPLFIAS
jgi:hypothetical protein